MVRMNAKSADIRITIAAVAKASRLANIRRIDTLLDKAVTLGMVFRKRHAELSKLLFDRVHHYIWPADEVFVVAIRRRQMALEQFGAYEALLARPVCRWIRQHMDDLQIEPCLLRFQLLTESNGLPILAAVKQNDQAGVAAVGERADDAHHRSDANAAGDQHVHVCRVAGHGKSPVRPIEANALARRQRGDRAGEVAQVSDGHLDAPIREGGTRRERERMPGDLEGTIPQR